MLTDNDLQTFRETLENRLVELDRNTAASRESREPVALDQASIGRLSRMDAMQQQAMALAAENRRQVERKKLVAALERLDRDELGDCVRCGDEIGRDRLEFDATITLCRACMKN